jgi:hypothetical protein
MLKGIFWHCFTVLPGFYKTFDLQLLPAVGTKVHMRLNIIPLLVSVFMAVGCAAPPLKTTSGRPEITVNDRSIASVRTAVVNYFVDQGFAPVKTDGTQLVFEREGSTGQALLMGMLTDNPESKNRITITLVENGGDVRVVGAVAAMGQSNFGRQQAVELRGKGYQQLQSALEAIKARAEGR